VGQNIVWVGQARVWVGHGLPGLIARTASGDIYISNYNEIRLYEVCIHNISQYLQMARNKVVILQMS